MDPLIVVHTTRRSILLVRGADFRWVNVNLYHSDEPVVAAGARRP
jgi:hypothetical protein